MRKKNSRKDSKNLFVTSFFGSKEFLYFYILRLFYKDELYGEEIAKKLEELTESMWEPNPGFIYPMLKKLSKNGFIEGEWTVGDSKHPRLVYKITEEGKEYYKRLEQEWIKDLREFIEILQLLEEREG